MDILRPDISSTDPFGNGTESAIRRQERRASHHAVQLMLCSI